jgi:hypothetical protein
MSETFLNKDGEEVEDGSTVVAKERNGIHFVRISRGVLLDPIGVDSMRFSTSEFKRVSEDTFRVYVQYLKTKNSLKYTQAERYYREQN